MEDNSLNMQNNQTKYLRDLGLRLRVYRKKMKISAVATAESAGISRVTLYRIEQGEPTVTMGSYISVIYALGLRLDLIEKIILKSRKQVGSELVPKKIRIANYKQLKRLAWQLKKTKIISPEEALEIYERNWRHVDLKAMDPQESELIQLLLKTFGRERLLV